MGLPHKWIRSCSGEPSPEDEPAPRLPDTVSATDVGDDQGSERALRHLWLAMVGEGHG